MSWRMFGRSAFKVPLEYLRLEGFANTYLYLYDWFFHSMHTVSSYHSLHGFTEVL